MQPFTRQEQSKRQLYIPDEKLAVFFMQNDYSNVCKVENGVIEQAFDNLPEVMQDLKEAEKGASFLGIDYFGPRDKFKLNKDLEDPEKSITSKDARDLTRSLYALFGQSPETKYFGLFLYAGHGMIKDGLQYILLNELDKNKGFYVLNQVEKEIRLLS